MASAAAGNPAPAQAAAREAGASSGGVQPMRTTHSRRRMRAAEAAADVVRPAKCRRFQQGRDARRHIQARMTSVDCRFDLLKPAPPVRIRHRATGNGQLAICCRSGPGRRASDAGSTCQSQRHQSGYDTGQPATDNWQSAVDPGPDDERRMRVRPAKASATSPDTTPGNRRRTTGDLLQIRARMASLQCGFDLPKPAPPVPIRHRATGSGRLAICCRYGPGWRTSDAVRPGTAGAAFEHQDMGVGP